jgi:hypothetical protein
MRSRNTNAMSSYQLEKSCVMERKFDFSYQLTQKNTNIMAKTSEHIGRLLKEVINIELCTISMNQEDGFCLSRLWKLLIYSLKEENRSSSRMLEQCLPEALNPLPQY